jgi:hypothetical protein
VTELDNPKQGYGSGIAGAKTKWVETGVRCSISDLTFWEILHVYNFRYFVKNTAYLMHSITPRFQQEGT